MCLTIPGKIKSIEKGVARVENGGRSVTIDLGLCLGAKVGDWVLYATDRAVKQISETDAKEIISLLEDHYHTVDVSKLPLQFKKILFKVRSREKVESRKLKVKSGGKEHDLTKAEIEYLLSLKGGENLETLYAEANSLRKEMIEDFVCIHGIIEFSNYCRNNCLYCGIRADNKELKRYRMSKEEIIETAVRAVEDEGYKLIVLQSGEDMSYTDEMLLEIVREIKKRVKVFIFLSVGERPSQFYKKALRAGATGSLIRFETSNPKLYEKLRPKHKLADRLALIREQIGQGYYVATGNMVGLPDQTISDIAEDLMTIKSLGVPMISSGPFIPSKGTPLANHQSPITNNQLSSNNQFSNDQINGEWKTGNEKSIEMFLKYISIARLMMPEIKIPVTTALETLDPENGRHRGLLAGANALMFNLTPEKYCKDYSIYDNKYREREKVWQKYGLFKGEESWEMLEERLML